MTDFTKLAVPCANLDSRIRSALVDSYARTLDSLRDALRCMLVCMPRWVDYSDPELQAIAHDQHVRRIQQVACVLAEMQFIAEKIGVQHGALRRRP